MNAAVDDRAIQKARLFYVFSQLDEQQKVKAREVLRRLSDSQNVAN